VVATVEFVPVGLVVLDDAVLGPAVFAGRGEGFVCVWLGAIARVAR